MSKITLEQISQRFRKLTEEQMLGFALDENSGPTSSLQLDHLRAIQLRLLSQDPLGHIPRDWICHVSPQALKLFNEHFPRQKGDKRPDDIRLSEKVGRVVKIDHHLGPQIWMEFRPPDA